MVSSLKLAERVGIRLIVEVLDSRPSMSDGCALVLLALAEDARDSTRISMPGVALLAARARCSERTAQRHLADMVRAGVVEIVVKSAPGRRAEYRIAADLHACHQVTPVPRPVDKRYIARHLVSGVEADARHGLAGVNSGLTYDKNELTPDTLVASPPSNNPQNKTLIFPSATATWNGDRAVAVDNAEAERARQLAALGELIKKDAET